MTKRKAIPARVMVSVAIRQAWESALAGCEYFACAICRTALHEDEPRILEHTPARALLVANGVTNPDDPKYLSIVHKRCAKTKTNGTPATCADGDIHKIAKAKRLATAREVHQSVLDGTLPRQRPPGKIKSRGFQKGHRPFRG